MARQSTSPNYRALLTGSVAGLATFAAMLLIAWAGVAFDGQRDLEKQTSDLFAIWLANIDRGNKLYATLEKLPEDDCSDTHLNALNTLVYKDNHITNIWFFPDGDTKAACSSSFGRFEPAHDFGPPEKAQLFLDGRQTWYRVPFERARDVGEITVIKKGRYGVSFYQTGNLATADDDLFYVSSKQDPYTVLFHAHGNAGLLQQYRNAYGPVFGRIYAQACGEGDVRLCYLTMIPPSRVVQQNIALLAIFAVFGVTTGVLVFLKVKRVVSDRHSPVGRIRHAIANGGKGFEPHYQPILTLETMKCDGCEVLARFEDAQGKLFPDEFVNIIQRENLTWEFTEIIITKALRDLKPLLAGRPGFKVSVNFFQSDLEDDQIQSVLRSPVFAMAAEAGLSLCCEILETGIRSGTSSVKSLEYLRSIGCLIAIDDFGTGYSNLAQIKALNPDLVKIDKMFVDDLGSATDCARGAFVQAILSISAAHGMKVCAEGVETMEQLASLRNRNVDYAQGYFFAKPMPIRDFSLYLLEQTLKEKMPTTGRLAKLKPVSG
ncbi:sensor c-di-GMP phosphodiesterase-like protein [Labrenzia sp. MBR-25]